MTLLKEKELMCAEVMRENGITNRKIARQFKVDESTIRYRLKRRADGTKDGRSRQSSVCDPYRDVIDSWNAE